MTYEIQFAESVKEHLRALTARQRAEILAAIETHVTNEPLKETRNRKPLRPNPLAPWELRVGKLREFGKSVAAIVPLKPGDQESLVLSNHPEFLALIAQSRREIRAGRSVSLNAMKRQFLAQESPDTARAANR